MFLANDSDGLTDAPLADMINRLKWSGKFGSFAAVRPPFNFHLAEFDQHGLVRRFRSSQEFDVWINGGYFVFRKEIFDYIQMGEELVLEPFNRLIQEEQLVGYKHEGFWRAMDTLRDRQVSKTWRSWRDALAESNRSRCEGGLLKALHLARAGEPLSVLCLGAHSDDIEIGAGGTVLSWIADGALLEVTWCVLGAVGEREREARASANDFLHGAAKAKVETLQFKTAFSQHIAQRSRIGSKN